MTAEPGPDPERIAREARLDDAEVEHLDLSGRTIVDLRLLQVRLEAPDLANLRAPGGVLSHGVVAAGRLTGMLWTGGVIRSSTLRGCRANLAGFAGTRMSEVRFEGCDLRDSDFSDAALLEVAFEDCDLGGADFAGARFVRSTMRGCRLEEVRLQAPLTGLGVPYADLIGAIGELAAAAGVEVLEA